jgi:hypothetical protein
MKCENCSVKVDKSFAFAIKKNQCPACGENIMDPETLGSYLTLQTLLKSSYKGIDIEGIAALIVANFELKQRFKDTAVGESITVSEEDPEPEQDEEVVEPEVVQDADPDAEFKVKQKKQAKEILKQMKEEVYEEAVRDQWGLGDDDSGILLGEDETVAEATGRMRQEQSHRNIVTGSRGAFRRSD